MKKNDYICGYVDSENQLLINYTMTNFKWLLPAAAIAILAIGCAKEADLTGLTKKVDDIDSRLSTVETTLAQLEKDVASLQNLVKAINGKITVASVEETSAGLVINFSDGTHAVITNGIKGDKGDTPVIGTKEENGVLYWTVNGEFLKDSNGNKIRVNGEDGATGSEGHTPVLGVKADTDGVLYWTVDGEFLKDENGNKVPATGSKGEPGSDGKTVGTTEIEGVLYWTVDGEVLKDGQGNPIPVRGQDGTDGTTPTVSIDLVGGVWVWVINGEVAVDENGDPIPVTGGKGQDGTNGTDGITPKFKIMDGAWYVSYDDGATFERVGLVADTGTTVYVDADSDPDNVILTINTHEVLIPKERVFTLTVALDQNNGVLLNETADFAYSVAGVQDSDVIDVDIIGIMGGWEAEIVPDDESKKTGVVRVTNLSDGKAKITVAATNHKGKADYRALIFEGGVLNAVIEAQPVPAEGGDLELAVNTNLAYTIVIPDADQSWISVAEDTRARVDKYLITVKPNTTNAYRSSTVQVLDGQGVSVKDIEVFQYPVTTEPTSIESALAQAEGTSLTLYQVTVVASSAQSSIVTDGTDFTYVTVGNLVPGTVVNATGKVSKNADEGLLYIAGDSAVAVDGATPIEVKPADHFKYYRYTSSTYFFTAANGTITKSGEDYIFNPLYTSFKYILEAPATGLDFDSLLDSPVILKGWVKKLNTSSTLATYVYDAIATEVVPVNFVTESAWTLSHETGSSTPDAVKVVVGSDAGSFGITAVSQAQISGYNTLEEAIYDNALSYADAIQYTFTRDASTKTMADILAENTWNADASVDFPEFDYEYTYMIALGIDELGCFTGKYAVKDYYRVDPALHLNYEDYLGIWNVNGQEWIIIPDEDGKSYLIDGMQLNAGAATNSGNTSVIANYDSEKGRLTVSEQAIGNYVNSNYGTCLDVVVAMFQGASRAYPNYPVNGDISTIFSFVGYEGNTYELRAGANENGKFIAYSYRWVIATGANAGNGNVYGATVALPETRITKSDKTVAAYGDYIGRWTDANGVIEISADEQGTGYLIDGLPGTAVNFGTKHTVKASYSFGKLVVSEQIFDTWDAETAIGQTYGLCDDYLSALFTYGGRQYPHYPNNASAPATIFTLTLQSDGSLATTAGKSPSSTFGTFTGYRTHWVIQSGDYAGKGNKYADLAMPTTYTRAAVASDEYLKWIGTYSVPAIEYQYDDEDNYIGDADAVHSWVIKEKITNESYEISGVNEADDSYGTVLASFDPATGSISVTPQVVGQWSYQSENDITEVLAGHYIDNSDPDNPTSSLTADDSAILFTGTISENTATLTPGTYGEYGAFTGLSRRQIFGGSWYSYGGYYNLPLTLTKVTGSGSAVRNRAKGHSQSRYSLQPVQAPVLSVPAQKAESFRIK